MTEIREIATKDTYQIRKEELRRNVSLSHKMAGDDNDGTLHLGLFHEGNLIGIASFMKAPLLESEGLQYQLRGMAITSALQGKGYGKELLLEAERRLADLGVEVLWCNARIVALDFYRKLGYRVIGPGFEIPEIGQHFRMFKRLG